MFQSHLSERRSRLGISRPSEPQTFLDLIRQIEALLVKIHKRTQGANSAVNLNRYAR
jgi:hypothetical protein